MKKPPEKNENFFSLTSTSHPLPTPGPPSPSSSPSPPHNARGPNTAGSQYFIVTNTQSGTPRWGEEATPWLNGKHVVFGEVDEASFELCLKLQNEEVDFFSRPKREIKIANCGGVDEVTA